MNNVSLAPFHVFTTTLAGAIRPLRLVGRRWTSFLKGVLMRPTKTRLLGERGQILMLTAFLLPLLLAFVGLVVDAGFLYAQRRQAQSAADQAALAGARILIEGHSTSDAIGAALEYAGANGYDYLTGKIVAVNIPPLSGEHAGDPSFVEVILEEQPTTVFIQSLIPGGSTVRARGVARWEWYPEEYALVVLDPNDCESYRQNGSGNLTITGGGIMINSDCNPDAMDKSGAGSLLVPDGPIHVHGGYEGGGSGTVGTTPQDYVPWTVSDPLAGVSPPSLGAPAPGSPGTPEDPITLTHNGAVDLTLWPGTYYGGLFANCSCTITLMPGIYIMAGGGFTKAGSSNFVGNGVMIYVTENPANSSGDGAPQPFRLSGNGALNLSPPTSGDYEGITFWQDVAITEDFFVSGSNSPAGGIFYAPGATMNMTGNSVLDGVQIIANGFYVHGNSMITINYRTELETLIPRVYLVE